MIPFSEFERWKASEFEILQVVPCRGVLAVYAEPHELQPGKSCLVAYHIHFLAVAKVTTRYFKKHKDSPEHRAGIEYSAEVRNDVVGLQLDGGHFEVCNECDNFAGYCMEGDDFTEATAFLPSKYKLAKFGEVAVGSERKQKD